MSNENGHPGFTRREALAAAAVGGVAAAAVAAGATGVHAVAAGHDHAPTNPTARTRMPVLFLPHGGGPWPFVEMGFFDRRETDSLRAYLQGVRAVTPVRPRALLVVSAHWEEAVPTVMSSERPPMFYDYYGFPPESYAITWPAPGSLQLAARVQQLLGTAGITCAAHADRGFDHGTFVPLKVTYPEADIPTIQLSLKQGLDPAEHIAIGRALAPLRDEGVFIVGSGMSYHNMRGFGGRGRAHSEAFDAWLRSAATAEPETRAQQLLRWASAPAARESHPREEHLLPLMVIAGAAGDDRGVAAYNDVFGGVKVSAFQYG